MIKAMVFGFHSINEFGQANVGVYAQAHPFTTWIIGLGAVFALFLITKLFMK